MEIVNSISPYFSIFAFIGTYCLIIAYDRSKMPTRIKNWGKVAEGTVIAIHQNPGPLFGSAKGEGYAPEVEFETPWGNHRHASAHYQTPSPYQVGQKVKVGYYFYRSIREVMIEGEEVNTSSKLWVWGIVLCFLGYPFVVIKMMDLL